MAKKISELNAIVTPAPVDLFAIVDDDAVETKKVTLLQIDNYLFDRAVIVNASEANVDFRVAAGGITNALFVRGSDGNVGINTATPGSLLAVKKDQDANTQIQIDNADDSASALASIFIGDVAGNEALFLGYFPPSYNQAEWQDRAVIEASSGAAGLTLQARSGDVRMFANGFMDADERLRLTSAESVFNESGANANLRVASVNDANALVFDADALTNEGALGLGVAAPQKQLHLSKADRPTFMMSDTGAVANTQNFEVYNDGGVVVMLHRRDDFATSDYEFFNLDLTNGNIVVNNISAGADLQVKGAGAAHLLFAQGGTNRVGINTGTPARLFHVFGEAQIDDDLHLTASASLYMPEQTAPGTPAAGTGVLYPKADGLLYWKDDAGVEHDLTGGGSGAQISGTPVNNQLAVWTNATTVEGDPNLTWDGSTFNVTGATQLDGDVTIGSGGGLVLGDAVEPTPGADTTEIYQKSDNLLYAKSTDLGYEYLLTTAVSETLVYAASLGLDLDPSLPPIKTVTLTGDITFTTSNLASGRGLQLRIVGDGSIRTLTFPAGWTFLGGPAPTSLPANAVGILSISAFGAADADVVAGFSFETTETPLRGAGAAGQVGFFTDPDSMGGDGAFNWDNVNKVLGLGTTTPDADSKLVAVTDNGDTRMRIRVYSDTATHDPALDFHHHGGTEGGPATATPNGSRLGSISFIGYSSIEEAGARIRSEVEGGDWNGTRAGAFLKFETTDPADTLRTLTERVRIAGNGDVGIGTPNPVFKLDVVEESASNNGIRVSNYDATSTFSGPGISTRRGRGTAAAPAAVIVNDELADVAFTGHYESSANFHAGASMKVLATENWSPTQRGAVMQWFVTPITTNTAVEAWRSDGGATIFNNGEADMGFRVAANGITNALVVDGATGNVGIGIAGPSSTLDVDGSFAAAIETVTDDTLDATNHFVVVDTDAAVRTVNLPAASTCAGRGYFIRNNGTSGNDATIDANASETINGALTLVLSDGQSAHIVCDGTEWFTF